MLTEGGGGVQEPLILADVICEQPLRNKYKYKYNVEENGLAAVVFLVTRHREKYKVTSDN